MSMLNLVLAGCGLVLLIRGRRVLRETTLIAPWWWAVVSVAAISTTEVVLVWAPDVIESAAKPLRYLAAATTFCPVTALLGAKRPQHHAWQWVVVALWIVLALPAAETLAFSSGSQLDVRDARGAFLWVLILVGLLNFLPTRYAASAGLFAMAQAFLFSAYLPLLGWSFDFAPIYGLALIVLAIALIDKQPFRRSGTLRAHDRVWLGFRDMYGALWGLRVQQRVNEVAEIQSWEFKLQWHGFTPISTSPRHLTMSEKDATSVHRVFQNVLRRFVSSQWIEERLGTLNEDRGSSN